MTRISITVQSRHGSHQFEAEIHEHANLADFHLDPETFYREWGSKVPELPHHEIEIVVPGSDFFSTRVLHMHRSRKSEALFVCFPHRIATIEAAGRIFRTWCLGSVATIVEDVDLNTLYAECGVRLEVVVGERYGIMIQHFAVA